MAVGVRSAVLEVAAVLEALVVFEIVGMCLFFWGGGDGCCCLLLFVL